MGLSLITQHVTDTAREISKSKKVQDVTTSVAPKVVNYGVATVTGSRKAGLAADVAVTTVAKTHSEGFTEAVAVIGLGALAASTILTAPVTLPLLIGGGIFLGIKNALAKKEAK
jgi:hypothetical protein